MKYLLASLLLIAACAQPADKSAPQKADDSAWAAREALASEMPQLEACNEALRAEGGGSGLEPTRIPAWGDGTFIELACGKPPGTGAYGYPLSLVTEWDASPTSPEGDRPRKISPTRFVERDSTGAFVPGGFVTQAIPIYDRITGGYVDLLYKYSGSGSCGMLVTYETPASHTDLVFLGEVRERSCDAAPCEDGSCSDPMSWDKLDVTSW